QEGKMLDLNFLTEEEYGKLMQVLQRDAELKRKDGDPCFSLLLRRMQRSLKDEKKKKCLTGQWFHEVKAQRFQEELEGTELLRASIKKKRSDSGCNDGDGKSSQAEEEKKVPRCPRRSKLPIRVPSIKLETPAPQQAGIIFEPETPADEFVMAEESKHRHDSLSGRVQILIESVPSEDADQAASAAEENSDVGTAGDFLSLYLKGSDPEPEQHALRSSLFQVSGSVLSVYSGDFGSVSAQGLVQFALDYDEKNREFQIFVSQCQDLAIVDEKKGRTDPYVKTYLLPDKARMGKRKTSVKKRTLSPIYNEVLRSLSAINSVDHRGVMNLSIKYIPPGSLGRKTPPSGEVHIWVKDTKDLPQLRPSGVDSFVKCYVLPDTSKKSYQKTRIVKRDSNPVFNHTIVYDGFHTEDLKDACVELTVWDHEKLTNHFLGGIRLGLGTGYSYGIPVDWMDSTQEEVAFWQEMMTTANEWIEGSLPLRSLAGRRKLK
uniref:Uncharacterized protein n=1 Tax=Varanus komodoensis TaxID=61221 RepID=A0A8D2Q0W5_VARKO